MTEAGGFLAIGADGNATGKTILEPVLGPRRRGSQPGELDLPVDHIAVIQGDTSYLRTTNRTIADGEPVGDRPFSHKLDQDAPVNDAATWRRNFVPRLDIRDKAAGRFAHVHDAALPTCRTAVLCGRWHGEEAERGSAGRSDEPRIGRLRLRKTMLHSGNMAGKALHGPMPDTMAHLPLPQARAGSCAGRTAVR